MSRINKKILFFTGIFLILTAGNIVAQDSELSIPGSQNSDTLLLDEVSLDSARFYLTEDMSKVENTLRGTTYINIDGKVYKLPYKITSITNVVYGKNQTYFRLTGISLVQNPVLADYVYELFKNPREKLKDYIPAKERKNSAVYLRYFEPYDNNSEFIPGNTDETGSSDINELDEFMADKNTDYVIQNYEDFPLPETIDIEVDMRKSPKTLTILGIDFNFDKLDKGFQKLLLEYGKSGTTKNQKSNSEKK